MDILNSILAGANVGIIALLFILGIAAFVLSTISGGGGSLILVPILKLDTRCYRHAPHTQSGHISGPSRTAFHILGAYRLEGLPVLCPGGHSGCLAGLLAVRQFQGRMAPGARGHLSGQYLVPVPFRGKGKVVHGEAVVFRPAGNTSLPFGNNHRRIGSHAKSILPEPGP